MKTASIKTDPPYKIGIDLGGTKTEIILLDPHDKVLHRQRTATPQAQGYQAIVNTVRRLCLETVRLLPQRADYTVGIGIPGMVDQATQRVHNANTTCMIGKPFQTDIENLIGKPVRVANDANCFTLAESLHGAAKGYAFVFGIIMGTGCGGGICINGVIRQGPHGIAGEWGHFSIDPQGARCYCGNRGCIETKISGSGVEAAFFKRYAKKRNMLEIVQGYRNAEPQCRKAFERFLDDFGRCVGGLISVLDPDAVVLGGGLSNIDELYTLGTERMRRYAFHRDVKTPLLKNKFGDSAGVFGAAWLGMPGIL